MIFQSIDESDERLQTSFRLLLTLPAGGKRRRTVKCPPACLSVCLSLPSTASATAAGGFATEVGRRQQISIDAAAERHAGRVNLARL